MKTKTILIVDDDEKLIDLLDKYLGGFGFNTISLNEGTDVLKTIATKKPDLVILDIMLGNENGLDILRQIYAKREVPVIMLTAKGEETDRIVGLELGADDYLPKPFNPRELLARINSVLRRFIPRDSDPSQTVDIPKSVKAGGFELNIAKQRLVIKNQEIELSMTEFRIFKTLLEHPNQVFSRDELMNIARGKDMMAFDRSIDVHVSHLRTKIGKIDPEFKKMLKTVWGTGYMMEF